MVRPQTIVQILRCFSLGGYMVWVEDGWLRTRGPQPLAGPLPASIKARRDELIAFLSERCGGTWPYAPDSDLGEAAEFFECSPSLMLDIVEALERRQAA